jgi:hypothetical protein
VLHHGEQLGGQGVQVNLLAQPGAERLNRLGGVVAAAVKAPVDVAREVYRYLKPTNGTLK